MKRLIKIMLGIIIVIIICIVVDFICIFTMNRPLFGIQVRQPYTYTGLFYNVYNCPEYPMAQIKSKKTKFSCAISRSDIGKVVEIVDQTKAMNNFACAEALEEFYEDDNYQYFFSCIKGKYIIVKYESGFQESVEEALKYDAITINDLDNYGISYIKYEK